MLSLDQEPAPAWLKNPPFLHSNGFSSASRFRRIWRITNACRASPVWPCCRPTRCRRSRTQPTSSSPRWWWRERPLWSTPFRSASSSPRCSRSSPSRTGRRFFAYPTGGGAYRVAKENISPMAGLIAAASLLVDYTLTVSVSISAGVLAITSAFPSLDPYRVELCLFFLADADGRQPARPRRNRDRFSRSRPIFSSSASSC